MESRAVILGCVFLALFLSFPQLAHSYTDAGIGRSSCGTWTADRQSRQAFEEETWVLGFLSGVGYAGSAYKLDPLNGTDAAGVWAWIDNYCQAHPISDIAEAAGEFVMFHHGTPGE